MMAAVREVDVVVLAAAIRRGMLEEREKDGRGSGLRQRTESWAGRRGNVINAGGTLARGEEEEEETEAEEEGDDDDDEIDDDGEDDDDEEDEKEDTDGKVAAVGKAVVVVPAGRVGGEENAGRARHSGNVMKAGGTLVGMRTSA